MQRSNESALWRALFVVVIFSTVLVKFKGGYGPSLVAVQVL